MTASPISDLNPILMTAQAQATFISEANGKRTVQIDQSFFPKYRTTSCHPDEVLLDIYIPFNESVGAVHITPLIHDNNTATQLPWLQ